MKTADLIPLILLELKLGDKYGFELTKNIETKSNGKIIIKQPTLYTLLKKLEKSKFITSYWQDSEIGGKRHYYKLTENGRLQASTFPSYETLLENINANESPYLENSTPSHESSFLEAIKPEPIESILPTEEVFSNETNSIDNSTEFDINMSNIQTLKDDSIQNEDYFAESKNVEKFTETINMDNISIEISELSEIAQPEQIKEETKSIEESIDENQSKQSIENQTINTSNEKKTEDNAQIQASEPINKTENSNFAFEASSVTSHQPEKSLETLFNKPSSAPKVESKIRYNDYVDFRNDIQHKKNNKIIERTILKSLATSFTLIALAFICALITSKTGRNAMYYIYFISALVIALIYPIYYIANIEKYKIDINKIKPHNLKIYLSITAILLTLIISIIVSVSLGKNSLSSILHYENFKNLYAPLIITCAGLFDILYHKVIVSKLLK